MRKIFAVFLLCFFLTGAEAQNGRPSVALVLGGGGSRGFAHIAVLELIEEMGIPVDMITGVSAGAIIGGLYAAGYSPAMMLEALDARDWASFFQDRPVSPFWNRSEELPFVLSIGSSTGIIAPNWGRGYSSGQKAYTFFKSLTAKIPSYIDFDSLPIPFRAGAVEVPAGKFELLDRGDLAEAIRSSMSIQGVFEPFIIDGKSYVDGGILNNLPVREVREMGFDIIIAVDLFAPPEKFETSLIALPDLMTVLYSNQMSREHHEYADVVLFPLPSETPTMDFGKGREIYASAREGRETFRASLEPLLEIIAARIDEGGESRGGNPGQSYGDMPLITPNTLIINGALPRDRPYIERAFSRTVMGKPLEEKNVTAFLDSVYETGNYHSAAVRADKRYGETALELILHTETENKILYRAGLDYEGTFSSHSYGRIALRGGFEFLGRDGFSLLLKSSIMDEISLGLSMLWPLGPHFFFSAEADLVRDQELSVKGLLDREETVPDRLLYFRGALKGGLRINSQNSFYLSPAYFAFMDGDEPSSMAGLSAAYTYSALDYPLFPTGGFRFRLENHLRLAPNDPELFDVLSVDLTGAVPLGAHFNIEASAFASSLFGETELPPEISAFNPERVGRVYFPHAPAAFSGENKAALSFALRFEPWGNLSILGGRMIFSLAVSAGGPFEWNDLKSFMNDGPLWNLSFGAALLPLRYLGLQIRTGAGGGAGRQPAPFISLDLGMNGFQKRLF